MKKPDIITVKNIGKLYKIYPSKGNAFWYNPTKSKVYKSIKDKYEPTTELSIKRAKELFEVKYKAYFDCEKILDKITKSEGLYDPTAEEIQLLCLNGFIEDTGLTYWIGEFGYRTALFDSVIKNINNNTVSSKTTTVCLDDNTNEQQTD